MTQPNVAATADSDLEWIQMRRDFNEIQVESGAQKFVRKFKQNPMVPIGCLATAAALSFGLWSFRRGEKKMSQMMMRTRIAAQGFTVVALIIGVVSSFGTKEPNKEN